MAMKQRDERGWERYVQRTDSHFPQTRKKTWRKHHTHHGTWVCIFFSKLQSKIGHSLGHTLHCHCLIVREPVVLEKEQSMVCLSNRKGMKAARHLTAHGPLPLQTVLGNQCVSLNTKLERLGPRERKRNSSYIERTVSNDRLADIPSKNSEPLTAPRLVFSRRDC